LLSVILIKPALIASIFIILNFLIMALNDAQRYLLKEILSHYFDPIKEFNFVVGANGEIAKDMTTFEKGIFNEGALRALQLILEAGITRSQKEQLKQWGVWDGGVEEFRMILIHPAPEVLLNLAIRNDNTKAAITREDVVNYIAQEVRNRIEAMEFQNIEPTIIVERLPVPFELQGFISSEQLMAINPALINIITSNPDVRRLITEKAVTLEEIAQLYDEGPEKLREISKIGVRRLLTETVMTLEDVSQLYDQSREKLLTIAGPDIYRLMAKNTNTSFQDVSQLYDEDPEKLREIAKTRIRLLLTEKAATLKEVYQLCKNSSSEKLLEIAKPGVRRLLINNLATLGDVSQLYDEDPEKLREISKSEVRRLLTETVMTLEDVSQLYDRFHTLITEEMTFAQVIELHQDSPDILQVMLSKVSPEKEEEAKAGLPSTSIAPDESAERIAEPEERAQSLVITTKQRLQNPQQNQTHQERQEARRRQNEQGADDGGCCIVF
jgi:predicted DNA-binding ArsR family transcriptional regulator